MKNGKRRAPPSRLRYEKKNPTISCRVPRDLYDRLAAVRKSEKGSFADIRRTGLGMIEVQRRNEADIRQAAFEDGRKIGYEQAERTFKVTYPCSVCGKTIELASDSEKRAAAVYMRQGGWHHGECVNGS